VVNGDGTVVLFTASEKQSVEDAVKDMGSDNGMGWLFSIMRYTTEQFNETIGADNSGLNFFARDDSYYYCLATASDVRLYREGGVLTADAITLWQTLIDMGFAVKNDIIARNGLLPFNA